MLLKRREMTSLKAWFQKPVFLLALTAFFYAIFEILNSTVVCRSASVTALTGLFSFLGFWSLVAAVILLVNQTRETRRFSWLWVALVALIVVLFLLDAYIGRTCFYN
jgi:hypothetical protein